MLFKYYWVTTIVLGAKDVYNRSRGAGRTLVDGDSRASETRVVTTIASSTKTKALNTACAIITCWTSAGLAR